MAETPESGIPKSKKPAGPAVGTWLALGAGIGAAIGAATKNIGVWLPIGVAIGLALGVGMSRRGK